MDLLWARIGHRRFQYKLKKMLKERGCLSVANQEFIGYKNAFRGLTALLVLNLLSVNIFPQLEKDSIWSFHFCQETLHVLPCQNYDTLHTRECNLNHSVYSQLTSMLDKDKETIS